MEIRAILPRLQFVIYLLESGVMALLLALAAAGSPEFSLGPIGRTLLAAAVPLPCHLLLSANLVWARRSLPARPAAVRGMRPVPLALPLPA